MIKVHPEQMPESDVNAMARSLKEIISAYFDDPRNLKEFEEAERENRSQAMGG